MKRTRIPEAYRELAETALRNGWTIQLTHAGKLQWISPEGEKLCSPSTPGPGRQKRHNLIRRLRKRGLKV